MVEDNIRLLIVEGRSHSGVSDELLRGAAQAIEAYGAEYDVITVSSALQIPTAIALAEDAGQGPVGRRYDGYVALGCVIRGETTHYDTVCNDSSRALTLLGLQGACIGNGILTVENRKQAEVRAEAAGQNKGGGAAAAALHLIALARGWAAGDTKGIGFRA